jgi:hypothetical protein
MTLKSLQHKEVAKVRYCDLMYVQFIFVFSSNFYVYYNVSFIKQYTPQHQMIINLSVDQISPLLYSIRR